MPGRNSEAPEIAWSVYSSTICQPSCSARSRQMRSWSAIEASRLLSKEIEGIDRNAHGRSLQPSGLPLAAILPLPAIPVPGGSTGRQPHKRHHTRSGGFGETKATGAAVPCRFFFDRCVLPLAIRCPGA
jgi:hypothetical protein